MGGEEGEIYLFELERTNMNTRKANAGTATCELHRAEAGAMSKSSIAQAVSHKRRYLLLATVPVLPNPLGLTQVNRTSQDT